MVQYRRLPGFTGRRRRDGQSTQDGGSSGNSGTRTRRLVEPADREATGTSRVSLIDAHAVVEGRSRAIFPPVALRRTQRRRSRGRVRGSNRVRKMRRPASGEEFLVLAGPKVAGEFSARRRKIRTYGRRHRPQHHLRRAKAIEDLPPCGCLGCSKSSAAQCVMPRRRFRRKA